MIFARFWSTALTRREKSRQNSSLGRFRVPFRTPETVIRLQPPAFLRSPSAASSRLALGFCLLVLCCFDARADFRLCNNTSGKVGITLGYKDGEGWVTEGWWNLGPRSCETLLRGNLVARFYYVYAIDYD